MSERLINILYKVYALSGVIPVMARLRTGNPIKNEELASIAFYLECQHAGLDIERAFEELERYTTWTEELIKL